MADLAIGSDGRSFWDPQRHVAMMGVDRPPSAIGCAVGDPSALARQGETPRAREAADPDGWCYGLMRFDRMLAVGESWQVCLDCPQQTFGMGGELAETVRGTAALRPDLMTPGPLPIAHTGNTSSDGSSSTFLTRAFAVHSSQASANAHRDGRRPGADRAALLPLVWLRDSVYIIRSLDLAGTTSGPVPPRSIVRATTSLAASARKATHPVRASGRWCNTIG